jgi:GntR family transcriptional regulator
MPDSINRMSDRPAYRQIADQLRSAITTGELAAGEQLPSERQLEQQYGVSRTTVRQAVARLQTEGLIVAEHGRGLFVRSKPPLQRLSAERLKRNRRAAGKGAFLDDVEAAGRQPDVEVEVGPGPMPAELADALGIPADTQVLIRRRRMLADGQPVQLATSYLPLDLVRGTRIEQPDTGPGGTYARLEELGRQLSRFEEEVSARMPLPEEAVALQLASGVPLIRVVRTALDQDGQPVEVNDILIAADRYKLAYAIPAD